MVTGMDRWMRVRSRIRARDGWYGRRLERNVSPAENHVIDMRNRMLLYPVAVGLYTVLYQRREKRGKAAVRLEAGVFSPHFTSAVTVSSCLLKHLGVLWQQGQFSPGNIAPDVDFFFGSSVPTSTQSGYPLMGEFHCSCLADYRRNFPAAVLF